MDDATEEVLECPNFSQSNRRQSNRRQSITFPRLRQKVKRLITGNHRIEVINKLHCPVILFIAEDQLSLSLKEEKKDLVLAYAQDYLYGPGSKVQSNQNIQRIILKGSPDGDIRTEVKTEVTLEHKHAYLTAIAITQQSKFKLLHLHRKVRRNCQFNILPKHIKQNIGLIDLQLLPLPDKNVKLSTLDKLLYWYNQNR